MKKFLALICAAIIFFAGCGNETALEVKTEKILPTNETLTLTHEGKISLSHELMIYSNVSGKVLEKYFKDGDEVTEGQKLFKIGEQDKETELLQTKAALGEAMTKLAKETTQKNSAAELQAEIYDLQERVKILEDELAAGVIHAPITGQLGIKNVRLGEDVQANKTVLGTIGRTNPAVVRLEISAAEKNFLTASTPKISLKFSDGMSYPRAGTINFLNDTTAEVTFENPEGLLLLGNTVQLDFEGVKVSDALLVPESAIHQRDGENFISVVDDNKEIVQKKISLGGKIKDKFIVTNGLKAGDSIVIEDETIKK